MRRIVIIISTLLVIVGIQKAQADSQGGNKETLLSATTTSWKNQDGSVAHLQISAGTVQPFTYAVTGTYINNAAGYGCQGTPYPLSGTYYSNPTVAGSVELLAFTVTWSNASADCMSTTSWTGFLKLGGSSVQIITDWNLSFKGPAGYQIKSGSDTFTRVTAITSSSLISE